MIKIVIVTFLNNTRFLSLKRYLFLNSQFLTFKWKFYLKLYTREIDIMVLVSGVKDIPQIFPWVICLLQYCVYNFIFVSFPINNKSIDILVTNISCLFLLTIILLLNYYLILSKKENSTDDGLNRCFLRWFYISIQNKKKKKNSTIPFVEIVCWSSFFNKRKKLVNVTKSTRFAIFYFKLVEFRNNLVYSLD